MKDTLNVITYEGIYFLKNMRPVSLNSSSQMWFANLMGIGWEKWIALLYANVPSGSLQCWEFTFWEWSSFSRILFYGLCYYCLIDSQTWCEWRCSVPFFQRLFCSEGQHCETPLCRFSCITRSRGLTERRDGNM